jgi:hypothetical protein
VRAYRSGPNAIATNIRTVGVSCATAKHVLVLYFRKLINGDCDVRAKFCPVRGWRCWYRGFPREHCTSRTVVGQHCGRVGRAVRGVIRFRESDVIP